jgi:FkbM family methyltransferase
MLTIYPEKQYPEAFEFCQLFLHEKQRPRYVMGRNEYADNIAEYINITGFIDDFTSKTKHQGKPILKTEEISPESLVVSAVILGRPLTALEKLKSYGVNSCMDYFNFFKYSGLKLKEIEIMRLARIDVKENRHKYQWLYDRLADKKSKKILSKLLNFRVSGDLNYMRGFEYAPDRQYFEDFLNLKPGEIFVDIGGYDGNKSLDFIKRCPHYKSIYFFEPEPENLATARVNLSKNHNVHFYSTGLAECKNKSKFHSGIGSGSRLCETGDIEIQLDTLDNLIRDTVTFIKMDIEGAESIALQGAREHILKDHPKLAICCYHRFDDFWRLPEQILAVRDDYRIYLRHYREGLDETVLYFIPDVSYHH